MTANTQERELVIWQDEPCPKWCEGKHGDSEHPEDRTHRHDVGEVSLRLHQAVSYGDHFELARVHVDLLSDSDDAATYVHIYSDDVDPRVTLNLKPAEADQLANAIKQALELYATTH